ncbi:hypothetical protein DFP72DRAFT_1175569 [Ephemerocybe angulata]|uniref:DUF6533 domain-containing protein n=1 Tax=Ephemerocybe angulata TaxID=980116 RepID=A0A8H6LYC1_9AGAR|nr:hypothetical protein DFP72DRAFT_1175569 [Tulosesus angulatus]
MSLSPEDIVDLARAVSATTTKKYITLGLYTFCVYYYLTTLAEEKSTIWPLKWRTGKIIFLVNRYGPIISIGPVIIFGFKSYAVLDPKACTALYISAYITAFYRIVTVTSEVAVLLCLHALLGAKRRYLAMMIALYTGLTLGANLPLIPLFKEASATLPLDQLSAELGYACTWKGSTSIAAVKGLEAAGYVSLAKAICISVLAVTIFVVRYRTQSNTLIHVIRRDSGAHIFSLTTLRLGSAIIGAFQLRLGFESIPNSMVDGMLRTVVPILSCRLLLNMRKIDDAGVRTIVSTLLFNPPQAHPEDDSWDDEDDCSPGLVRYDGIGRQRAGAVDEKRGENLA